MEEVKAHSLKNTLKDDHSYVILEVAETFELYFI